MFCIAYYKEKGSVSIKKIIWDPIATVFRILLLSIRHNNQTSSPTIPKQASCFILDKATLVVSQTGHPERWCLPYLCHSLSQNLSSKLTFLGKSLNQWFPNLPWSWCPIASSSWLSGEPPSSVLQHFVRFKMAASKSLRFHKIQDGSSLGNK